MCIMLANIHCVVMYVSMFEVFNGREIYSMYIENQN